MSKYELNHSSSQFPYLDSIIQKVIKKRLCLLFTNFAQLLCFQVANIECKR